VLTRPASHTAHRGGRNRKDCCATPPADAFTFDDLSAALSPLLVNLDASDADGVTRPTALPTSSATSTQRVWSTATPTGRPKALPSSQGTQ